MANTKVALRRRQARTTKLSRGVAAGSAYTITDRGFTEIAAGTSGVTTLDSGTWTPVAGSLLVAIPAHEGRYLSVPIQFSLTDTFPGTSGWVESATAFKLGQPNYGFRVSMFTTVVTSTGSGHVTLTRSPSDTVDQYTFFQIYEITGQAATAWIGATGSQAEYPAPTSSTCTVTMSATPAATSLVFGAIGTETTGGAITTPPAGWSELVDHWDSSFDLEVEAAYKDGSSTGTPQWTTLAADTHLAVAIEIRILGSAGPPFPRRARPSIVAVSARKGLS